MKKYNLSYKADIKYNTIVKNVKQVSQKLRVT